MAKKVKLTKNGQLVYPITIVEAIASASDNKSLATILSGLDAKAAGWTLVQDPNNSLKYDLKDASGTVRGSINIPQDTFLDSAAFNTTTHILTLTFNTASGKTAIPIDLSDLVDTYISGNGIDLNNNAFSIKLDTEHNSSRLTVTSAGLSFDDSGLVSATDVDSTEYEDVSSLIVVNGSGI